MRNADPWRVGAQRSRLGSLNSARSAPGIRGPERLAAGETNQAWRLNMLIGLELRVAPMILGERSQRYGGLRLGAPKDPALARIQALGSRWIHTFHERTG